MSGPDSFAEAVQSTPHIHQDVTAPNGTDFTLVYRDADMRTVFEMGRDYEDPIEAAEEILAEYWVGEYDDERDGVDDLAVDDLPGTAWLNCVMEGFLRGLGMDPDGIAEALEDLEAELDEADEGNG